MHSFQFFKGLRSHCLFLCNPPYFFSSFEYTKQKINKYPYKNCRLPAVPPQYAILNIYLWLLSCVPQGLKRFIGETLLADNRTISTTKCAISQHHYQVFSRCSELIEPFVPTCCYVYFHLCIKNLSESVENLKKNLKYYIYLI